MQENKQHTHGFKMPEGYLNNFEKDLALKLKLEKIPSQTGFKAPNTYFESIKGTNFTSEILKTEPKVINLRKLALVGVSIAACLAVIFTFTNNQNDASLETIAMTNIEDYIISDNISISLDDISAEISDDEIEMLEIEDVLFQETALEEYLLETIDTYTIINE
ncbi:hypothetical protein ULMS_14600 [Patiriisocius marinistellae]|uniref:Uncharacterized protein n=1 Tax=Patiriisocius marinistellae TaxID=2494560 RepID=A0A5J4FXQ0_9FLAO|nr:hypothetical protein [Patiriisocius marinistellae]GEQ85952.1 hypothetical protein ULMS_14600 [Patiriisocius marinistellae]